MNNFAERWKQEEGENSIDEPGKKEQDEAYYQRRKHKDGCVIFGWVLDF